MPRQRKGHYNILFLGLDGAGKTRAILRLNHDPSDPPKAAWGFNCTTIAYPLPVQRQLIPCLPSFTTTQLKHITCFDVGGHEKIRKIWPNYYADVYACVFVVDCTNPSRFEESRIVLHDIFASSLMSRKPLLILANRAGPDQLESISAALDIQGLVRRSQQGTSYSTRDSLVLLRACNLDDASLGLRSGVEWLLRAIEMRFIDLSARVSLDILTQEKKWAAEKEQKKKSAKVHPA